MCTNVSLGSSQGKNRSRSEGHDFHKTLRRAFAIVIAKKLLKTLENRVFELHENGEISKKGSKDRCFFRGESGGGAQGHGNGPYGDHGLIIIQVASHYRR